MREEPPSNFQEKPSLKSIVEPFKQQQAKQAASSQQKRSDGQINDDDSSNDDSTLLDDTKLCVLKILRKEKLQEIGLRTFCGQ